MRTLSRYFALRFLGFFIAILVASTLVIVMIELLLNLDEMLKVQKGPRAVLDYLFLRIPSYYLKELVQVAAFGGAFFSLGTAARWHEVTAMKAGGISPYRAVVPLLCTAALLAGAAFGLNETWGIQAHRGWKQRLTGAEQQVEFGRGTFWFRRGQTVFNVRSADRETNTLEGVRVFELDDLGQLEKAIHAERARIAEDGRWHVESASIREFSPARAGPRFEHVEDAVLDVGGSNATLMGADARLLSLVGLREYIQSREGEGQSVQRLVALLHDRLSEPLAVWTLALLAVPLALRVESARSFGPPAVWGAVAVSSFLLVRSVGRTVAADALGAPAEVTWSLILAFTAAGLWLVARVPR